MLKNELINLLKKSGAYDVRIADPHVGFEHSIKGRHPLTIWPECKSVIVIINAKSADFNNTYVGNKCSHDENRRLSPATTEVDAMSKDYSMIRLANLFKDYLSLKCVNYLNEHGCKWKIEYPRTQDKLCAYEAGIGIYGRSGLILHPELGNRFAITVVYTDAELEPDKKCAEYAPDFNPCARCNACVKNCPAKAHGDKPVYHDGGFDREKCVAKRAEIDATGYYCHRCFAVCPAGKFKDAEISVTVTSQAYKPHNAQA